MSPLYTISFFTSFFYFIALLNIRFTNNTYIPGKATLEPEDMYDKWSKGKKLKGPFSAPGSAPIFGEGCGVNGGNPNGCIGMRKFLFYSFLKLLILSTFVLYLLSIYIWNLLWWMLQ